MNTSSLFTVALIAFAGEQGPCNFGSHDTFLFLDSEVAIANSALLNVFRTTASVSEQ